MDEQVPVVTERIERADVPEMKKLVDMEALCALVRQAVQEGHAEQNATLVKCAIRDGLSSRPEGVEVWNRADGMHHPDIMESGFMLEVRHQHENESDCQRLFSDRANADACADEMRRERGYEVMTNASPDEFRKAWRAGKTLVWVMSL
jgi:hypothetical protein